MKRRLMILLLAAVLCVALAVCAYAEEEPPTAFPSAEERFSIVREDGVYVLYVDEMESGQWVTKIRNDQVLSGCTGIPTIQAIEGSERMTSRYREITPDGVYIYSSEADYEYVSFTLEIFRDEKCGWRVGYYGSEKENVYAALRQDCTLICADFFSVLSDAGILYETPDAALDGFDPRMLMALRESMRDACIGATRMLEFFAGAEPLYICPKVKENIPVYVRPDENSPRAHKGKAQLSLNDWVCIFCREGDWLFVLYETSESHYRTGWARADNEYLRIAHSYAQDASFDRAPAQLKAQSATALYDDPIHMGSNSKIAEIAKGTLVTVLFYDGYAPAYVEVQIDGKLWRGFVNMNSLNPDLKR